MRVRVGALPCDLVHHERVLLALAVLRPRHARLVLVGAVEGAHAARERAQGGHRVGVLRALAVARPGQGWALVVANWKAAAVAVGTGRKDGLQEGRRTSCRSRCSCRCICPPQHMRG